MGMRNTTSMKHLTGTMVIAGAFLFLKDTLAMLLSLRLLKFEKKKSRLVLPMLVSFWEKDTIRVLLKPRSVFLLLNILSRSPLSNH